MLKRKHLVRSGFLGHALLLFTPNLNFVKGEPLGSTFQLSAPYQITADTSIVQLSTDTSFAYAAAEPLKKEIATAPRITLNRHASAYMKEFLKREKEALDKVKQRSAAYFKVIDTVFTKYGLPTELKYLAVVESYLKTNAVSRVGAKGMWQFMPQTARDLGLKITKKYDERTYLYKSTVAAARYLKDLYSEFGDWLLVMAAYNGGPGTVHKAIRRSGSRNFWALQYYLPAESRAHVKRFIGTHYYFEGEAGYTTLTKSETIAYKKALEAFYAKEEAEIHTNEIVMPVVLAANAITVAEK